MNGLAFNKVFAILIHICMVSSYFRFLPIKIDSKLSRNIIDSNLRAFLIQKKYLRFNHSAEIGWQWYDWNYKLI